MCHAIVTTTSILAVGKALRPPSSADLQCFKSICWDAKQIYKAINQRCLRQLKPAKRPINLLSPFNNLQRLFSGFLLAFANYLCFKTSYL
jgi:hypothetical protein